MSRKNSLQMKRIRRYVRFQQKLRAAERIPFYGVISKNEPAVQPLIIHRDNHLEVFMACLHRFRFRGVAMTNESIVQPLTQVGKHVWELIVRPSIFFAKKS